MIGGSLRRSLPGVALALALTPGIAQAQWGGEIRGQMGIGGDEIASVTYSDGMDAVLEGLPTSLDGSSLGLYLGMITPR